MWLWRIIRRLINKLSEKSFTFDQKCGTILILCRFIQMF